MNNLNIDFVRLGKYVTWSSLIFILATFYALFSGHFEKGIDFTGGIIIEGTGHNNIIDTKKLETNLNEANVTNYTIQLFSKEHDFILRLQDSNDINIVNKIKNIFKPYNFEYLKIEKIGSQMSKQAINQGVLALTMALLGIMIYLWCRFNWKFGIAGIITLIHDFILTIGAFMILQYNANISTIAAILTIIGYSTNDSVVIFDRIRDNMYKAIPFRQKINISINSTLSRTFLTSFTTLISILPMIFLGISEVREFCVIIFIGIIIGTYSSIFISAPALIILKTDKL